MRAAKSPVVAPIGDVAGEMLTIGKHFSILFNSAQAVQLWGMSPSGHTGLYEIFVLVTRLRIELGLDSPWEYRIEWLYMHDPSCRNTYPLQDNPRPPKNAREYQMLVTQLCGRLERIVLDPKALKALRRAMRKDVDAACRIASMLYTMAQITGELP